MKRRLLTKKMKKSCIAAPDIYGHLYNFLFKGRRKRDGVI